MPRYTNVVVPVVGRINLDDIEAPDHDAAIDAAVTAASLWLANHKLIPHDPIRYPDAPTSIGSLEELEAIHQIVRGNVCFVSVREVRLEETEE